MADNVTAAIFAVCLFGALASVAFSINAIARAWVARGRDDIRLVNESAPLLADARLVRLEQAVDAIALEVERISEHSDSRRSFWLRKPANLAWFKPWRGYTMSNRTTRSN
jgi:hypothetical protein